MTTDDGSAHGGRRFRAARGRHGVEHERTRPCTPRTSGEAERLIRSGIRAWA